VTAGFDSGPGYYVRGGIGGPVARIRDAALPGVGSYFDHRRLHRQSYLDEEADRSRTSPAGRA